MQALGVRMRRFVSYIRLAVNEFLDDNCAHLSAAISYYVLFSLFPLLLAAVSIMGFVLKSPDTQAQVVEWFRNFLPEEFAELVADNIGSMVEVRGVTGVIALIGLLWAGTSMFNVTRKTLNIIWGITIPRPFFRERLMELVMMAGVGSLMLISFGLTIAIGFVSRFLPSAPWLQRVNTYSLGVVLPAVIIFLIFIFLYRFTPYVKLRWKDVWIEALLAAIAVEIVKHGFVWYISSRFNPYGIVYGSIGVVVALLIWVFISAIIFLFCAELASLRHRGVTILGRKR